MLCTAGAVLLNLEELIEEVENLPEELCNTLRLMAHVLAVVCRLICVKVSAAVVAGAVIVGIRMTGCLNNAIRIDITAN